MTPSVQSMWRSWVIVGSLVVVCAVIAFHRGGMLRVQDALTSGGKLFLSVLRNRVLGFALAGFLTVLLPSEVVVQWMGRGSGWRGLFLGTLAGTLTPGGPFTHFPILASFLTKGAGVGPVCAYIAAWALLGLNRFLVWELPILGAQVAVVRIVVSLWVPPLVGWLGGGLYHMVTKG